MYRYVILHYYIIGALLHFFLQWDDFVDQPLFPSLRWYTRLTSRKPLGRVHSVVPQTDAGVAELMTALKVLSVGAQEVEQGPGVQDIAGRGVLKPPDLPWPACPQGRHRRGPGLDRVGGVGGLHNQPATGFA